MLLEQHCLFTRRGANNRTLLAPPRAAILLILADLEQKMKEHGLEPAALECRSWPVPPSKNDEHTEVARIRIHAEPGTLKRSLVSWYEWQHPQWHYSHEPRPAIDNVHIIADGNTPPAPRLLSVSA